MTGLRLIAAVPGDSGYRVSKDKYPVLSAPSRVAGSDPKDWGRFDTDGETLYVAQTRQIAFAEVLSGFKRRLGSSDALAADAAALGMSLSDFVESVASDWGERGFMGQGAIPAIWRKSRSIFEVILPNDGWWVDIEHPDSISVVSTMVEPILAANGINHLTTSTLRGDNRIATTAIAQALRMTVLDDGSRPLGIHFGSKHGGGWCRAVWFDPTNPRMASLSGEPLLLRDDDLIAATARFGIRAF